MTLNNCMDLTVITGKNDVGKSNILKALNLFFCQQTDYMKTFNFSDDYSKLRKDEINKNTLRGQQFISISICFLRGSRMPNSLPPRFTVTKRWDMHSQECKISSDVHPRMKVYAKKRGIKYSEKITAASLSTFLNKIKYIYIPAIKDDYVFSGTLNILQQNIFDSPQKDILDEPFSQANDAIQMAVSSLQDEFKAATGVANSIKLPTTLNFARGLLQIETNTPGGFVPLAKRGDGIKAHYLPKILNYIASNSKYMYLWGFEEPENSYEYRRCMQIASEFEKQYCKNSQIFITSHSPAFFGNGQQGKVIFRICSQNGKTCLLSEQMPLDEELGYIEIYRNYINQIKELDARIQKDGQTISSLRNQLQDVQVPTILTEGKTDTSLLKLAIQKLGVEKYRAWTIRPIESDNTSNNDTLRRFLLDYAQNMKSSSAVAPVIGMFDRDVKILLPHDGKEIDLREQEFIKIGKNVYAFAIPVPHQREKDNELSIEHYFTDEEIKTEIDGKRLYLGYEFYKTGVHKFDSTLYCKDRNKTETAKIIEHESKSYVTKTDGTGDFSISKARFVECIETEKPNFSTISFAEFSKIFAVLDKISNDFQVETQPTNQA